MNLKEHITKVLKEEMNTKVLNLIKSMVLDYVDFDICKMVVDKIPNVKDQYFVIMMVEEQLKSSYREKLQEELQDYLNNHTPLTVYVSISGGVDCKKHITESKYLYLLENLEKKKKFLTNHMGIDFTGKIEKITKAFDVPYNFYRNGGISLSNAMWYLNDFGPMYFFELGDYEYLYQDRGNKDWFIDEYGHRYIKDEFLEKLGLDVLGLRFSDIVNMYFKEEI
jgi:hypothetical protein